MGFCKERQNKRKQRREEKSKKRRAGEGERGGEGDGDRQKELGKEGRCRGRRMEALPFSEVD